MAEPQTVRDDEMPPAWEGEQAPGRPIDLILVASKIVRRWPLFLLALLGGGVLGFLLSFAVTPTFTSKVVFLPPPQQIPSGESSLALSLLMHPPSSVSYDRLLMSDSVLSDVVEHLNLQPMLKAETLPDARTALSRMTSVTTDSSGFVTLAVSSRDPKLAQQIATAYMNALSRLNNRLQESAADQQREFYQGELEREKNALDEAEANLERGQEKTGVVLPQSQTQAGLNAIDTTRAQIRQQQVLLASLLKAQTDQSPEVVRVRSQLQALEDQLHLLEQGQGTQGGGLPAAKAPSANLEFVRLEREVKYHQTLFDVMAKQYEDARLASSSTAPAVQVVDFPELPLRKSAPSRRTYAIGGALLFFLLAAGAAFARDRWEVVRGDAANAGSIAQLRDALRHPGLRP